MENFPHAVGKLLALMEEFTEGLGNELFGECGNEKFCTIRNLPVLPGLGIIERGEDWNGPIKFLSVFSLKGPINLPFSSSF
jgi:hypothetical protein